MGTNFAQQSDFRVFFCLILRNTQSHPRIPFCTKDGILFFATHPFSPRHGSGKTRNESGIFYFATVKIFKNALFKTLRFAAIAIIVYLCMAAYLLISERRLSFPRAERDEASESVLRQGALRCQTKDGKWLSGFISGDSSLPTVLYFADRGEDAATFLAHAKNIPGFRFAAFNYRGSAGSEGSPKEKFLAEDILAMIGCAGAEDAVFLGHGTGAIAAYNSLAQGFGRGAVLVDPEESFKSALSSRYRIFFPEFLARTKTRMNFETPVPASKVTVVLDDPRRKDAVERLLKKRPEAFTVQNRGGASLLEVLTGILGKMKTN